MRGEGRIDENKGTKPFAHPARSLGHSPLPGAGCSHQSPGIRSLPRLVRDTLAVTEPTCAISAYPLPHASSRSLPARGRPVTVISANLWHDWPRCRFLPQRLESFARLVEAEKADILLLQEVARLERIRADQWLAERLGMASFYCKANGHERGIGFEEGVAVLSRFPLSSPRVRRLGKGARSIPFVRRIALGCAVQTHFGRLLVFSVHLGLLARSNARQLAELRFWVREVAGSRSAVVGGDFNAAENSPQILSARAAWIDAFRHFHPKADGTTHEIRLPWGGRIRPRRLDYIFLHRGREGRWVALEARHVQSPKGPRSDHSAVLLRLDRRA